MDLNRFLAWYLGARSTLSRGAFNIIFVIAGIPVLFMSLQQAGEEVGRLASQGQHMAESARQLLGGLTSDILSQDPSKLLREMQQNRENVRQLFAYESDTYSVATAQKPETNHLIQHVNLLVYLLLIPVVRMRLRDSGQWHGLGHFLLLGAAYALPMTESLKVLNVFHAQSETVLIAQILSFFGFLWLCAKGTERRRKMSERYLPGDSPDDPY